VLGDCASAATFGWDFGDGGAASGSSVSHSYDAPGSYSWLLTVTADGATCTRTDTIAVTERTLMIYHPSGRRMP
jgi:PKD repeat protein